MNINIKEKNTTTSLKETQQKCLAARWLLDENSKLYCQWVVED